jgi:hypothetical protein
MQKQIDALLLQQDSLNQQNQQLQGERDQARNSLSSPVTGGSSHEDHSNLLKLRAAVSTLQSDSRELARLKAAAASKASDPTESEMRSWLDRANKLKEKLKQMPDQNIPEIQLLTEQGWLSAARDIGQLQTDADFNQALSALRNSAKSEFVPTLQNALRKYAQANNNQLPTEMSQLKPFFTSSVDDSLLQRYEITQPGVVTLKPTPLDDVDDKYYEVGLNTISGWSTGEAALQQATVAFSTANNGQSPTDPSQLLPYVKTPVEQAALQKLLHNQAPK